MNMKTECIHTAGLTPYLAEPDAVDAETGRLSPALLAAAEPVWGRAADALSQGAVVAFPTETVYGLGACIDHPEAVEQVFRIKGRPNDNPLIVHVASRRDIRPLVHGLPPAAECLSRRLMPGPLTLVLPRSELVPDCVSAGLNTVGIRIPEPPLVRAFLARTGRPVAAPSANLSGFPSPTTAYHVLADIGGKIPFIVDGGACRVGLESTVLDLSGPAPLVLRPGEVSARTILETLRAGRFTFHDPDWVERLLASDIVLPDADDAAAPRAPGMKYRHYAPRAAVHTIDGQSAAEKLSDALAQLGRLPSDVSVGVFGGRGLIEGLLAGCADRRRPGGPTRMIRVFVYGTDGDASAAAHAFFDALRILDQQQVSVILAESLPRTGVGAAYMNRLSKACGRS